MSKNDGRLDRVGRGGVFDEYSSKGTQSPGAGGVCLYISFIGIRPRRRRRPPPGRAPGLEGLRAARWPKTAPKRQHFPIGIVRAGRRFRKRTVLEPVLGLVPRLLGYWVAWDSGACFWCISAVVRCKKKYPPTHPPREPPFLSSK